MVPGASRYRLVLTAILLRYYHQRDDNLHRIIDDLKHATRPPDLVVVWDQARWERFKRHDVEVIVSSKNYGSRARYAAAMLLPESDQFLFIDDDTTLYPDGIERLLEHSAPGRVVCVRGWVGETVEGDGIYGGDITEPVACDWMAGWVQLVHRTALANYHAAASVIGRVPREDALMSRVNDCVVAPVGCVALDPCNVGQDSDPASEVEFRAETLRLITDSGF